jgi:hypothetical protein
MERCRNCLSCTVWMCSAMVASVPMPFASMSAMRSDSDRRGGGAVEDSLSANTDGTNDMPTANAGS